MHGCKILGGFAFFAILGAQGCASNPTSSAGWRFEYLKPPTIQQPLVVSSGPAPVGLVGSATYGNQPLNYMVPPQAPTVIIPPAPAPATMYSTSRTTMDCQTLQDACDRIRVLEAQRPTGLTPKTTAERLPMPGPAPVPPAKPCD